MTPLYAQDHDYSSFDVLAVDDIPINLILVQKMLINGRVRLDPVDLEGYDRAVHILPEREVPDLPVKEIT